MRRLRSTLVERLSAAPRPSVVDRLRVAVLALDSDAPLPADELVDAAGEALRLGDLELSERLARAATASGGEFQGLLTLAYALAWQGRGREADAVLAQIDPAGLPEDQLMAWALPQAANQFWMLSEPERATAFPARHPPPGVDAGGADHARRAGGDLRDECRCATTGAEPRAGGAGLPAADDTALGWAGSTAALSCARTGLFDQVDAMARACAGGGASRPAAVHQRIRPDHRVADDRPARPGPGHGPEHHRFHPTAAARSRHRRGADGRRASWSGGQHDEAIALLRKATAALAPTGYSWGSLGWMLLAQALGQRGMPVEAGKALSRAESRHGLKSMLFAPELALARAWTCHARKDSVGAVTAAREAARPPSVATNTR